MILTLDFPAGTIAFAGTVAYVLSFALGAGPVPGLLVPEINSESLRGNPALPTLLPVLHAGNAARWCCIVCQYLCILE